MTRVRKGSRRGVAGELRALLDCQPAEEVVHQFFKDRVFEVGVDDWLVLHQPIGSIVGGVLSKFPITPDRIPDFTVASLNNGMFQTSSRISFVELKRPGSSLYTARGTMSKDLNDAWMECVETSRLVGEDLRNFLRRLVVALDKTRLWALNAAYSTLSAARETDHSADLFLPWCTSVIVIGRRMSLDSEGMLRTRELSASTARNIQVVTYDTVLDWLVAREEVGGGAGMRGFVRDWYW